MADFPGSIGNDTIDGTAGADTISDGNGGNDILNGLGGADVITTTGGTDTADGGTERDRLIVNYFNTANAATTSGAFSGSLAAGYSGSFLSTGRIINFSNIEDFTLTTDDGADVIVTGDGDDTVTSTGGNDTLTVGMGNDILDAGSGVDYLNIDLSDELAGVTINFTIAIGEQQSGGAGSIQGFESFHGTITGSAFGDSLTEVQVAGNATFNMGAGDDFVEVAQGTDVVDGGADSDRLSVNYFNTANAATSSVALSGNLAGGYSGSFISSGRNLTFSNIEHFNVVTHGGADTIFTGDGNDTISTTGGNDLVTVGQGNDVLDGGANIDSLSIDLSDETEGVEIDLTIGAGSEQQTGGSGSVMNFETFFGTVTGSDFDDRLLETGQAIGATFNTGGGDDFVQVSLGADIFNGGAGRDTLFAAYTETANAATTSGSFSGSLAGGGYSGSFMSNGRSITFSEVEDFMVGTDDGSDTIVTGDGDDTVFTTGGNDLVTVGQGNDVLDGGTLIDSLSIDLSDETEGVEIDLTIGAGLEQQTGGTGSIINFETFFGTVTGSDFDDRFLETGQTIGATFNTGGGDDFVQVSRGADIFNGGAGRDTLFVAYTETANAATTSGTLTGSLASGYSGTFTSSGRSITFSEVEDFMVGTDDGADIIVTGDGDDVIFTTGGNDNITAAGGDDLITGGANNDTINGGDGSDTASYADGVSAVTVDLNIAVGQAVGGGLGIDTLISIENLIGSAFNDVLTGNGSDNILRGGVGDDALNGNAGSDTADYSDAVGVGVTVDLNLAGAQLVGGGLGSDTLTSIENLIGSIFADSLTGNGSDNRLDGGEGNDSLFGGAGNDSLIGGDGVDTASYADGASGVTVNLALLGAQVVGGGLGSDTLSDIENLIGSNFADTLAGNASANVLSGGSGSDILRGGVGNDTLNGGANLDTASYSDAASGVTVSLAIAGVQSVGGGLGNDTLLSIESLIGSGFGDNLFGNGAGNTLSGGAGNDILRGGAGNDTLNGGGNIDTASYADGSSGVTVNLSIAAPQTVGGGLGDDTLLSIENLIGSGFADTLTGSTAANSFTGGAGNDVLQGGAGNDVLNGGGDIDTASYADAVSGVTVSLAISGPQAVGGGLDSDTLIDIENLIGSSFADALIGGASNNTLSGGVGDDTLEGGLGDDVLDGGADLDTASYSNAASAVRVSLGIVGPQNTIGAGLDTLISIEHLTGSGFNDKLFGSTGNNFLNGGDGNDRLDGRAGDDELNGGNGADLLVGGGSGDSDTLLGGDGDDTYQVQDINDTVVELADGGSDLVRTGLDYTLGANVERLVILASARVATGNALDNIIVGTGGGDTISGLNGADTLRGGAGRDTILGGSGVDILDGGAGKDTMTGGAARDTFQFRFLDDFSNVRSTADVITDFDKAAGEKIQINLIDANTNTVGDDDFEWIASNAFSGTAGELRFQQVGSSTFVEGDVDGDGVADLVIKLDGLIALTSNSFIGVRDLQPNAQPVELIGLDEVKGLFRGDGVHADMFGYLL